MNVFRAAWLVLMSLIATGVAAAQDKEKKGAATPVDLPKNAAAVVLQTEDGVILTATYWKPKAEPRTKKEGSKTTGVVVIPNPRGHTQRECYPFASELADQGLAVVTFDFRGAGQSTQIVSTAATRKADSGVVRAEEVQRNAQTIDRMTFDLDAIKQFLLRENNAEKINIRQYSILAVGDLASVVTLNWIASREFGNKNDYTREGGDISAICLVNPSLQFKNYRAPQRLGDSGETLPIYVISTAPKGNAYEASERLARLLRLPEIGKKGDDRRPRPGGWNNTAAGKKAAKGAVKEIGIEIFRGDETAELRRGITGFLLERTKSKRETAWEGGRDVDQGFKVLSRSDQD
jgi:alpha-beta hydrolase superfamily lysophospholipase